MDWPDEATVELDSMAQGGAAVGRVAGRAVFAAGGLPGEQVRVRLGDRQRAFARGEVIEVLRAAPERAPSFCPLEQSCSAADWRWIEYGAQRRFKAAILRDQLRHLGGIDVDVVAPPDDSEGGLGYRITAELHVVGTQIGYYLPGTRRVADVPACCLHHPLINTALGALRPLLNNRTQLRNLSLRCSPATGEVLATMVGRGDLRELARGWHAGFSALVGVVAQPGGRTLVGRPWIEQYVAGRRFRMGASSFFQVNHRATPRLIERVRALLELDSAARLLDLFCGVGLFALTLADGVEEVVGIEEWAPAVVNAHHNAQINAVANVRFEQGSAERAIERLDGYFDRVVLDPPRRGCAPELLEAVARLRPARVVYVSCHPGTLARDCKLLAAQGYAVTSAEVIDMFPHTHHVESIVQLAPTS